MKKQFKTLTKSKMSSICGNGFVQTSTDVRQANGCKTITVDRYNDDNNNGKLDKTEKFTACSYTMCSDVN
ncbi:hypothetical protein [Chryseobacterium daeguense]|uniref:hypothetical protein n=1 Tax=Chryseobacterium daeguense TaxID=412438 RepID=UPI00055037A6|nr:hypothetical protein [Chryseobacterium daeguense]